jgi:uncharacterized protein (TIGR00255 family)
MTGFGASTFRVGTSSWRIEARSVNHKGLAVRFHAPPEAALAETNVAAAVRQRLQRGSVDIYIAQESEGTDATEIAIDQNGLEHLMRTLQALARALDAPPPTLDLALRTGSFVSVRRKTIDPNELQASLLGGLERALDALVTMRLREGEALALDLRQRLERMVFLFDRVATLAPTVLRDLEDRLRTRVAEAAQRLGVEADQGRIVAEIVVFADKADISEELVRARSHVAQFAAMLGPTEEAERGRRLDFLTQELLREINTMGSKGRDAAIATDVVDLKVELEKVREQVQNIA